MRDRVQQAYNTAFDRWYGVSTLEIPPQDRRQACALGDEQKYVPSDYLALHYLLRPLRLRRDDVFVDIGCGLGRAVFVAAGRGIRRAVGIEYDAALASLAERNARGLRGARAPVEICRQDATTADFDGGTVFWMYNPFGAKTMVAVLQRLHASHTASPRKLRIGYLNPALAPLLDAQGWLHRRGQRRFPGAGDNGHAIYWSTARP